jgi:hypothetical protein
MTDAEASFLFLPQTNPMAGFPVIGVLVALSEDMDRGKPQRALVSHWHPHVARLCSRPQAGQEERGLVDAWKLQAGIPGDPCR